MKISGFNKLKKILKEYTLSDIPADDNVEIVDFISYDDNITDKKEVYKNDFKSNARKYYKK